VRRLPPVAARMAVRARPLPPHRWHGRDVRRRRAAPRDVGSAGDMRSGFATVAGRPNVGKSTLVNALCGGKVAIVSDKPQTTRRRVGGIANGTSESAGHYQLALTDLPGFQRPLDPLTERMQRTVDRSLEDVETVLFVLSARERIGAGDRFIAGRIFGLGVPLVIALNKADRHRPPRDGVRRDRLAEADRRRQGRLGREADRDEGAAGDRAAARPHDLPRADRQGETEVAAGRGDARAPRSLMALLALVDVDGTLLLSDDLVAGEAFGSALRDCYPVEPPTDAVARTDHAG